MEDFKQCPRDSNDASAVITVSGTQKKYSELSRGKTNLTGLSLLIAIPLITITTPLILLFLWQLSYERGIGIKNHVILAIKQ